jgi:hypothetical protein
MSGKRLLIEKERMSGKIIKCMYFLKMSQEIENVWKKVLYLSMKRSLTSKELETNSKFPTGIREFKFKVNKTLSTMKLPQVSQKIQMITVFCQLNKGSLQLQADVILTLVCDGECA